MILVLKHIAIEGPGTLGDFLKEKNIEVREIELYRQILFPRSLSGVEAVISLGGPMNVYETERYPFLAEEDKFIKRVLRERVPFLGICLGSQLLAKAAGAKVVKAQEKEIGIKQVFLTDEGREDQLFSGLNGKEITVFQWHEDTFNLPDKAVLLASGKECRNQAFRIGPCAYGFQSHVEVTGRDIELWCDVYLKLDSARTWEMKQKMLREYSLVRNILQKEAETIFENFFRIFAGKCACKR